MYLTHNDGKSVAAERFIKTLENTTYKYMTPISSNMCIDKLDETINKYNNTFHRTIKMKSINVNPSMYIDFNIKNNKKGCKFDVGDYVRMWKYKCIFAKGYVPNLYKEVFVITEVRNTIPSTWHM